MKTIRNFITLTGVVLCFSGCAGSQTQQHPTFNKNNKRIIFVNGKSYLIPRMAMYNKTQLKNIGNNYKIIGCRDGDVNWSSSLAYNDIDVTVQKYKYDVIKKYYNKGEAGCSSPLSNQEYQYVLNQQNQRQANARAQKARSNAEWAEINRQTIARNAQRNQMMQNSLNNYGNYSRSNKGYKTYDAYGNLRNSNDCYTAKDAYGRYVKTCK
jgi:hypothetical protein